jgi:hypothetical protein
MSLAEDQGAANDNFLITWRYQPPVDVENSGKSANVIVWKSEPVTSLGKACGDMYFLNGDRASVGYVQSQLAFIFVTGRAASGR